MSRELIPARQYRALSCAECTLEAYRGMQAGQPPIKIDTVVRYYLISRSTFLFREAERPTLSSCFESSAGNEHSMMKIICKYPMRQKLFQWCLRRTDDEFVCRNKMRFIGGQRVFVDACHRHASHRRRRSAMSTLRPRSIRK